MWYLWWSLCRAMASLPVKPSCCSSASSSTAWCTSTLASPTFMTASSKSLRWEILTNPLASLGDVNTDTRSKHTKIVLLCNTFNLHTQKFVKSTPDLLDITRYPATFIIKLPAFTRRCRIIGFFFRIKLPSASHLLTKQSSFLNPVTTSCSKLFYHSHFLAK